MEPRIPTMAAASVLAIAAAPALSQISYVSQARSVSSSRPAGPQNPAYSCSISAPDFGPFSASCLYANQNSTLSASSIVWSGFAGYAGGSPPGTGSSDFDVTFDLTQSVQFTWSGTVSGQGAPPLRRLSGPGADITLTFDGVPLTGTLQPGRYRLQYGSCCLSGGAATFSVVGLPFTIDWSTVDSGGTVNLVGGSFTLSGDIARPDASTRASLASGSVSITGGFWAVTLPRCDADINTDGIVNSQDFFDFLSAFFASNPLADFNRNGVMNSQDFFDFLAAFFTVC